MPLVAACKQVLPYVTEFKAKSGVAEFLIVGHFAQATLLVNTVFAHVQAAPRFLGQ
jgi:hypothetical protein